MGDLLLTRDEFRTQVFARDHHQCVICKEPAVDAHHILERRLFSNGGYFLSNGSSLCEQHHLEAEMTILSCETIRKAAGITKFALPDHFYSDVDYDKWGNVILPNGQRSPGELFYDDSVQKILAAGNVLSLFTNRIKYPRTYHLPWSPGVTKDDRILQDLSHLQNHPVVVTEKMDGENTTFYTDYMHARSVVYSSHPSRSYVRSIHSKVCGEIPEGWRICGENVYAKHSILYRDLKSYFLVFSIWNAQNQCLSWKDTQEWAEMLELATVPVLYEGSFDQSAIRSIYKEPYEDGREGYVVRIQNEFHYKDFRKYVGKFVRKDHLTTSHNWLRSAIEVNQLKSGS